MLYLCCAHAFARRPPEAKNICKLYLASEWIRSNSPDDSIRGLHAVIEHRPKRVILNAGPTRKILAVTRYRLYIFQVPRKGVIEKTKDVHLYDISDVDIETGAVLCFRVRITRPAKIVHTVPSVSFLGPQFVLPGNPTQSTNFMAASPMLTVTPNPIYSPDTDPNAIRLQCGPGLWPAVVTDVINSYQCISNHFPNHFALIVHATETAYPTEDAPVLSMRNSFFSIYKAYCDYYRADNNHEFDDQIDRLFTDDIRELDLNLIVGAEPKSEISLNLWPVLSALKYDEYFVSIQLKNIARREIVQLIAEVLRTNQTLSRITLEDVGSDERSWVEFCKSLLYNTTNRIQILQLCDGSFGNRAMASLGEALSTFNHKLKRLDLRKCSINSKGFTAFFKWLETNWAVSLGIQTLRFTDVSFDREGTLAFENWLIQMRTKSQLSDLRFSSSRFQIGLSPAIRHIHGLTAVDFSGLRIDGSAGCISLAYIFEQTCTLERIVLANCSLVKESLEHIHEAIVGNAYLKNLHYSLADNNLGTRGVTYLTQSFSKCSATNRFSSLDLSGIKMKDDQLPNFFESLSKINGLLHLRVRGVTSKISAKEVAHPNLLADFIHSTPVLDRLDVSGGWGKAYIVPLLRSLWDNVTLRSLDISSNGLGDKGADEIVQLLRHNVRLIDLQLDDNRYALTGLLALRNIVFCNHRLCRMSVMISDLPKVLQSESDVRKKRLAAEAVIDIQLHISRNATNTGEEWTDYLSSLVDDLTPSPLYYAPEPLEEVPSTVGTRSMAALALVDELPIPSPPPTTVTQEYPAGDYVDLPGATTTPVIWIQIYETISSPLRSTYEGNSKLSESIMKSQTGTQSSETFSALGLKYLNETLQVLAPVSEGHWLVKDGPLMKWWHVLVVLILYPFVLGNLRMYRFESHQKPISKYQPVAILFSMLSIVAYVVVLYEVLIHLFLNHWSGDVSVIPSHSGHNKQKNERSEKDEHIAFILCFFHVTRLFFDITNTIQSTMMRTVGELHSEQAVNEIRFTMTHFLAWWATILYYPGIEVLYTVAVVCLFYLGTILCAFSPGRYIRTKMMLWLVLVSSNFLKLASNLYTGNPFPASLLMVSPPYDINNNVHISNFCFRMGLPISAFLNYLLYGRGMPCTLWNVIAFFLVAHWPANSPFSSSAGTHAREKTGHSRPLPATVRAIIHSKKEEQLKKDLEREKIAERHREKLRLNQPKAKRQTHSRQPSASHDEKKEDAAVEEKKEREGSVLCRKCSHFLCPNFEESPGVFPACARCRSAYCSAECQRKDWTEGNHKSFCLRFSS
ncbi:leucine-rich repeat-containing protein [Planoprotostelium fungivorum]|uniref:Leucine-rich repeat-containing protein n=1 Tax=Planoprotostelium fungivorum TaxID=1890364 RepID=A0A2P6NUT3_9EUKA|nr:leucine-rich repeat-containing protein [Planoprotostelium fungivorum]